MKKIFEKQKQMKKIFEKQKQMKKVPDKQEPMKKVPDKQKQMKKIFEKQEPMKNKILMAVMFGVILFSMTSVLALESQGTFRQTEEVRIAQVCDEATYITISSITYPNSTVAISNINMTSAGSGEFYYLFNSTNEQGRHDVRGISDGCEKTFATYFEITPFGKLGVLIFLVVLSFTFIGFGMALKNPILGFIGSILLILSGMYSMIYGISDVTNLYTRGIAISLLGLGFILMVISAYEWLSFGDTDE